VILDQMVNLALEEKLEIQDLWGTQVFLDLKENLDNKVEMENQELAERLENVDQKDQEVSQESQDHLGQLVVTVHPEKWDLPVPKDSKVKTVKQVYQEYQDHILELENLERLEEQVKLVHKEAKGYPEL